MLKFLAQNILDERTKKGGKASDNVFNNTIIISERDDGTLVIDKWEDDILERPDNLEKYLYYPLEKEKLRVIKEINSMASALRLRLAGGADAVKLVEYSDKAVIGENILNGWYESAATEHETMEIVNRELESLKARGKMSADATANDLAALWVKKANALRNLRAGVAGKEREALGLVNLATDSSSLANAKERALSIFDNYEPALSQ